MNVVTRPALRWHGGKWKLAPWIISHFPPHRVYVEPFGGAASVLLRKPISYAEIYNDMDDEVVNLFQVCRGPRAHELASALHLTPFSETEFKASYMPTDCQIERARRTVVKSYQGFGSNAVHRKSGFRSNSNRSGTTPAHDWANYPEALIAVIERLRGVTITCRSAFKVMAGHDAPETLHYVDPPYVMATRTDASADYAHEMTDSQHGDLLAFLKTLKGRVVLSGYPCAIYDDALQGWTRAERKAFADGASERTEVLWMNYRPAMNVQAVLI